MPRFCRHIVLGADWPLCEARVNRESAGKGSAHSLVRLACASIGRRSKLWLTVSFERLDTRGGSRKAIIHLRGEFDQVFVPSRMMGEDNQDVVPARPGHHRRVVEPILPRTPFANNPQVASGQSFHELDIVVRKVRRCEDLAQGP